LKILFGSFRYDPTDLDGGSGFDHDFYHVFQRSGIEPRVVGPFEGLEAWWERAINKLYKKCTGLSYAKFRISSTWRLSSKLNKAVADFQPDVVFTIWPNFLVFYRGKAPTIYAVDTCLYGQQIQDPTFGKLAMKITEWEEQKAFNNATLIITHSYWSKRVISKRYEIAPDRILVFPVPASLPVYAVPKQLDILSLKKIEFPLRLLLVGRVYQRKGVDIAIRVTELLNQSGIQTELTICGLQLSSDLPFVHFVGPFKKSDPGQLRQYSSLYERAHLLIHPARFEATGIVQSEAAAFGTPTITNDVGGIGTTVADNISGIVLPKDSPPEVYTRKITELVNDPQRYYQLCRTTRQRYEDELNWEAAGRCLMDAIRQVTRKQNAS
jgi:glycosyltransferase involved in cell wall biosynthesis